jgi:hypothetical protein
MLGGGLDMQLQQQLMPQQQQLIGFGGPMSMQQQQQSLAPMPMQPSIRPMVRQAAGPLQQQQQQQFGHPGFGAPMYLPQQPQQQQQFGSWMQ